MTPQNDAETESGEPSSYQHMEKTLSTVVSAGQDSQESINGCSMSSKFLTEEKSDEKTISCPSTETQETTKSSSRRSNDNSQDGSRSSFGVHQGSNENFATNKPTPNEARVLFDARSVKPCSADQAASVKPLVEETAIGKLLCNVGSGAALTVQTDCSPIPERPSPAGTSPFQKIATDPKSSPISKTEVGESYADAELSLKQSGTQHTRSPQSSLTVTSPVAAQVVSSSPSSSSRNKPGQALRRGKWTVEEEAYVARVIQDFNSGFLNAPAGTTLRSYLSEKLQCDPMRITKKFTGDACIGKRVFHPAVRSASNSAAIDKAQAELDALEKRWRRRLEMQQRESAKKAAASAAAANAAAPGRRMVQPAGSSMLNQSGENGGEDPGNPHYQQNAIAQTASWLDRANAILRGTRPEIIGTGDSTSSAQAPAGQPGADAQAEIENQMREVQRLIYEGPLIQQNTAGLPHLLDQSNPDQREQVIKSGDNLAVPVQTVTCHIDQTSSSEHADKRMRTGPPSGAEDAEALVGFLRSVRASAASGQDLSA